MLRPSLLAEFIGTFALVFAGTGAIVINAATGAITHVGIAFTFGLGSALAAAGGILWAMKYPQIEPLMGIFPGIKAFTAAVVGGIGSVFGAVIGGFVLGLTEILLVAFFPALSGYRDAISFMMLIAVLIFKPTGLMGEDLE